MENLGEMAGAALGAVEDSGEYVGEAYDAVEYEEPSKGHASTSVMGACFLMCLGIVLFPLACVLLGWNEKNAVCESRMILQAEEDSVQGSCDDSSEVEGKLAFFSCKVDPDSLTSFTPITSFNMPGLGESLTIKSAAASQKIEMYQCIEDKDPGKNPEESDSIISSGASLLIRSGRKAVGDDEEMDTYKYRMGWTDQHFDSTTFKATPENIDANGCPDFIYNGQTNHNPQPPDRGDGTVVSLGTQTVHATSLKAGVYTVSNEESLRAIRPETSLLLTPFRNHFSLPEGTDNIITEVKTSTVAVHAGQENYLSSCRTERLGCIRISYKDTSELTHVSVMAKVGSSGNTEPEKLSSSWGCEARSFVKLYPGEMSKEDFISKMKAEAGVQKWVYRIVGLFMAWLAVWCFFEPISAATEAVADYLEYIPVLGEFVGGVLEGVMDMIVCVTSVMIGCGCGLLVIGIVWIVMRPFVGMIFMTIVFMLFIAAYLSLSMSGRKHKVQRRFGPKAQQMAWGEQAGEAYPAYPAYAVGGEQQPLLQDQQQQPTYG